MATVKAIEGRSVHQIQSGQVIVDLNSVVKELVENALDAGATSIEVRFKSQGVDSIEVQDNGKGIAPEDFATIALKHYTSKLSSYEDLSSLDTFGFRGEALSSLCALSNFHVLTARAEDGAVGKKLEFEDSGKLKGTSVVAAQRGTTVAVENLFYNLPVRRKELEKNIKREYGKVVSHLYAYACISVGVRFAVSNQMPKGKKVNVFSTKPNTTTKENITNVFGAKTLLALVKLDLNLEMESSKGPLTQSARNWATQATDRSMEVQVQGHISKPVSGEGRQAPDRQMFFVNSRPCALPQVSKAFNEVYKSFNVSQSPFIFANLVTDTNAYDVNVSPDKRTIMLHDQTALLESLKASLTELFEQTDHTVPQSQLPNRKLPSYRQLTVPKRASTPSAGDGSDHGSESGEEESESHSTAHVQIHNQSHGTPPSLIHNWIARDTNCRSQTPGRTKGDADTPEDIQKHVKAMQKQKSVELENSEQTGRERKVDGTPSVQMRNGNLDESDSTQSEIEEKHPPIDYMHEPDPMSTPYDDLFSQRPPQLPKPVQDFNALMDSRHANHDVLAEDTGIPDEDSKKPNGVDSESEIPAVAPSSQKTTPGPVQNAFDRMRPKRTPLQTAEITVGNTTTTTVIGSDLPYKRRRVHQPVNSQRIAQFGGSPLAAHGLRNFAAPGSYLELDSSETPTVSRQTAVTGTDESEESSVEDEDGGAKRTDANDEEEVPTRGENVMSRDAPTSDPLDALLLAPADEDEYDEDYLDEHEKKIKEDEKVARLIQEAELAAAHPTEVNLRRASQVLKNTGNRKESTFKLSQYVETSVKDIENQAIKLAPSQAFFSTPITARAVNDNVVVKDEIDDANAESRLSLSVSKTDFERMDIIGQFNMGFILAVRPGSDVHDEDELFIVDQHAADEKYNYERLQRAVTLQSQRLVRPKPLELTAVEEELVLGNTNALKANGFEIETTSHITDDEFEGHRCRLLTLPISGEKTFDPSDLEELLHLLSEAPSGSSEIPRPKKVQSMLAMRACRSSIMVGKTLTSKHMQKVVRHMGDMEKPWNCPHGRPTMRHLAGLGAWNAWKEGDVIDQDEDGSDMAIGGRETEWKAFLKRCK